MHQEDSSDCGGLRLADVMDDIFTQVVQMLVDAEFAAIAVAHNIRKMTTKGYCVCSEVAVGPTATVVIYKEKRR